MSCPTQSDHATIYYRHSNHPPEKFIKLLQDNQINCLVDVRSKPYSGGSPLLTWESAEAPCFGTYPLSLSGSLLGGLLPDLDSKKKANRLVAYDHIRHEDYFTGGLTVWSKRSRSTAPVFSVRKRILLPVTAACLWSEYGRPGVQILHIRGDGRIQPEEEFWKEEHG